MTNFYLINMGYMIVDCKELKKKQVCCNKYKCQLFLTIMPDYFLAVYRFIDEHGVRKHHI